MLVYNDIYINCLFALSVRLYLQQTAITSLKKVCPEKDAKPFCHYSQVYSNP